LTRASEGPLDPAKWGTQNPKVSSTSEIAPRTRLEVDPVTTESLVQQPYGVVRVHGPWAPGPSRLWGWWNPLAVDIDGNPAGLVWSRQTSEFPVKPGSHSAQVLWARAHHIRSRTITVDVGSGEIVDLASPALPLFTIGFPKIRPATSDEVARAEANRLDWHFFGSRP
jgi:hypothetical protein